MKPSLRPVPAALVLAGIMIAAYGIYQKSQEAEAPVQLPEATSSSTSARKSRQTEGRSNKEMSLSSEQAYQYLNEVITTGGSDYDYRNQQARKTMAGWARQLSVEDARRLYEKYPPQLTDLSLIDTEIGEKLDQHAGVLALERLAELEGPGIYQGLRPEERKVGKVHIVTGLARADIQRALDFMRATPYLEANLETSPFLYEHNILEKISPFWMAQDPEAYLAFLEDGDPAVLTDYRAEVPALANFDYAENAQRVRDNLKNDDEYDDTYESYLAAWAIADLEAAVEFDPAVLEDDSLRFLAEKSASVILDAVRNGKVDPERALVIIKDREPEEVLQYLNQIPSNERGDLAEQWSRVALGAAPNRDAFIAFLKAEQSRQSLSPELSQTIIQAAEKRDAEIKAFQEDIRKNGM